MSSVYDKYQVVIGLEVHAQLITKSKAYAYDKNEYGSTPNTNVSVLTLAHPGTLPVFNEKVIEHAIRLGTACNCTIAHDMHFARKNYFYADLPKGYQITQDTTPICTNGEVEIELNGEVKKIGITRIHIEEDAGKSIHDQDPYNTLIDLNRAGVPLLEIVSEPDLRSSEEAYAYLSEIRKLVRYLDVCDGNMEEGSMRCDANISVMLKGSNEFGERVEVKNMNSIRNVQRAIESEIIRQVDLIEAGESIHMETRTFDALSGKTIGMRSKEQAHDYRYFPEPDLQPLLLTDNFILEVQKTLPPLPKELKNKYITEYKLSDYDASVLTEEKDIALYFENVLKNTSNFKSAANWVMVNVKSHLNQLGIEITEFNVSPDSIAEIIQLIDEGKVSNSIASQKIFPVLIENPSQSPSKIAEQNNWIQNSNEDDIKNFIQQAIDMYPDKVKEYNSGKKGLKGLFMGEVMKLSKGKADPKSANSILEKMLEEQA